MGMDAFVIGIMRMPIIIGKLKRESPVFGKTNIANRIQYQE